MQQIEGREEVSDEASDVEEEVPGEAGDIQGLAEGKSNKAHTVIMQQVELKLRGHYQYYGVTNNYRGIARFHREVTKLLFKWMNRRSQRRSYRWDEFEQLLKIFPLPPPRVRVTLFYRARMTV